MDINGNEIPYTDNHDNQIIDTVEAFGFLLFVVYLFKRMRYHAVSGVVLVISSILAFVVLMNADMTSDWAFVFWGLLVVVIISVGKIFSRVRQ
jgi:hypothetical protein